MSRQEHISWLIAHGPVVANEPLGMAFAWDVMGRQNVAGAIEIARELGPGHTVATVAVDTGLKYLAGDLYEL